MLTNAHRMNLINRLQVLQEEMAKVTQILIDNTCALTEDDLSRAADALLGAHGTLQLNSLEKQIELGMDESVLVTYHPLSLGAKLRPYNGNAGHETVMLIQHMIDRDRYTIQPGDESSNAFCVRIPVQSKDTPPELSPETAIDSVPPDAKDDDSPVASGHWTFSVTETKPAQPLFKLGPRKLIYQMVSEETLAQHIEMCGDWNFTRVQFESWMMDEVLPNMDANVVSWISVKEAHDVK